MLRPSYRSIEADYERFVVIESLDKPETLFSSDCDRRCQGIGQAEVWPTDAGGGDPCRWAARMRVDQMVATFGGT